MDHKLGEGALTGAAVDLLAVGLTSENWKASEALVELDSALGGKLISTLEAEGFDAKAGTSRVVHTLGAVAPARIFVFGLGASAEVEAQGYRDFGFAAAAATIKAKGKRLGILATSEQASQVALGVEGGAYRFTRHKSEAEPSTLTECVWCNAGAHAKSAVDEAHALAAAVARARDLVNEPAGHCDPNTLLAQAQELAQLHGLELRVLEREELEAEGYGCLLGVGRGSELPTRLIHLCYHPEGESRGRLAYVGKGITFDSGGYDLKPASGMLDMKIDMAGAAAVLGAMDGVGATRPQVEVHGIIPTCENLVNGRAYKPGDVLRSHKGKTVEIGNTDAEGRLILADALEYAADLEPDLIVDLATLTGACVVALGDYSAGLWSNSDAWAERFLKLVADAGETFWRMPLDKRLREQLDSPIADIKNVGKRWGGAITAALFLAEFVGDRDWIHLDIAGPAHLESARGALPKGATGFGVLSLVRLAQGLGAAAG